jgi:hypothetical protein
MLIPQNANDAKSSVIGPCLSDSHHYISKLMAFTAGLGHAVLAAIVESPPNAMLPGKS